MTRDIVEDLLKWKESRRRKPLLLTGVRQCGKTYIVKKFGEENYKNCVCVNFEESPKYSALFEYDFDVERIIKELSQTVQQPIIPGETLVFFDEIQECPKAITSLKYFNENMGGLHMICAGSLLGVALRKEDSSFPVGKVNRMQLFPMSFREFVIACGEERLLNLLKDWPTDREIPELYTVPMKKLLKDYYIVGGMPEAVLTWIETNDYEEVEKIQSEILRDYADDFSKHASLKEVPKIRWIWDSVPVQLAKENNKFVFSHVKEGKRSAELEDALQWLKDAGLVTRLELVTNPSVPLSAYADTTYFKVYMSDVGLLRAKSGIDHRAILDESHAFIEYKGAFTENYVLNELIAAGITPYFWRSGNTAEIDFIYEKNGKMIPVEVKAAENTQAKSYRQFCKKYAPATGFKLSLKNLAENMVGNTRTVSLPLYMAWSLSDH